MATKISTPPIAEPLTIEECRAHLNVTPYEPGSSDEYHPDDTLIMAQLTAAREWAENFLGFSVAIKEYELALDKFPAAEIELEYGPVVEVVSITYVTTDSDDALVVDEISPTAYVLDNYQSPAWVLPAVDAVWPTPSSVVNAVKIKYRAGYAVPGDDSDAEALPGAIRIAMLLTLAHLYEHREDSTEKALISVPNGAQSFLRPLRQRLGMA